MDFFNIGAGEIILILFIALLVFGPGKLPEIARGLGKAIHEFRKYSSALTRDFKEEFEKEVGKTPDEARESPQKTENVSELKAASPEKKGDES